MSDTGKLVSGSTTKPASPVETVARALNLEAGRQRGLATEDDWDTITAQERGGWRLCATAALNALSAHGPAERHVVWVCAGCAKCQEPSTDGVTPGARLTPDTPCTDTSPSMNGMVVVAARDYDVIAAERAQLREALAFYAHPEHIEEDRGALAQEALGSKWIDEWQARPVDRWDDEEGFDMPGCQMCGAHASDPCDCFDPEVGP